MVLVTESATPGHSAMASKRVQGISKGGNIQSIPNLDNEAIQAEDSSAPAHYGDSMCVAKDNIFVMTPTKRMKGFRIIEHNISGP